MMQFNKYLFVSSIIFYACTAYSESPALPLGLDIPMSLPEGLGVTKKLLDTTKNSEETEEDWGDDISEPWGEFSGFLEHRYADRIHQTDLHGQTILNESRLRLSMDKLANRWSFQASVDLLNDNVAKTQEIDLESGAGWVDLRKLILLINMSPSLDLLVGRQTLTWGTGDMLFLNDLFPKDWHYSQGREITYIKAPSDAIKLSWFNPVANLDLVYTPRFDSDRYISGERMSFWNGVLGRHSGRDDVLSVDQPNEWFKDNELAIRLFRNFKSMELALYGYKGFFKTPAEYNPGSGSFTFPEMSSLGASLRTPLGSGIFNFETAYWRSEGDRNGTNPLINNGETRYIFGYEWEAWKNFTIAFQYYGGKLHNYDQYIDSLPANSLTQPELHEIFTLRLTQFMINQKLKLTWFNYYTPEFNDIYIRPEINYQLNDNWSVEAGAVSIDVDDEHPNGFFGQLKFNSNIFMAIRYSFAGDI